MKVLSLTPLGHFRPHPRRLLGQAIDQSNRLLTIPVSYLIDRRRLIILPGSQSSFRPIGQAVKRFEDLSWPKDVMELLTAIERSPTAQEIQDLSLIDSFWDQSLDNPITYPREVADSATAQTLSFATCANDINSYGDGHSGLKACQNVFPEVGNPFFFPNPSDDLPAFGIFTKAIFDVAVARGLLSAENRDRYQRIGETLNRAISFIFWGIDRNLPWSEAKRQIENAFKAEQTLNQYPFPGPATDVARAWINTVGDEFRAVVLQAPSINPEELRTWTTLSILSHWTEISERVEDVLEDRAERAKRRTIIKAIGLTTLGLVLAVLALPTVIKTGLAFLMKGFTTLEKAQAAKGLSEAQAAFAESDAAFAAEVARVQKKFEDSAEGVEGDGDNTALYIIGGLAAAGVIAWALFG